MSPTQPIQLFYFILQIQSAGVGRTGTFIALEIIIQRMKQEKKINIFELVKQLRAQRMKMVQTIDQYVYLYKSALELAEARGQHPQGRKIYKAAHRI